MLTRFGRIIVIMLVGFCVFLTGCASTDLPPGGLNKSDLKRLMALRTTHVVSKEESAVEQLPPMTAQEHERLGDQCLGQGDINRAFLQYDKALQLDKNNLSSRYKIAMIFLQKRLSDEAAKEFEGIIKADENYVLAYEGLGMAAVQQKRYEDAERFFLKALALNPNLWRSHNFLGLTYSSRLDFDRAIAEYQKAIALKPDHVFLFNNLGLSYYFKGRYEEAVKAFNEALKIGISNPKVYNNLALALGRLGRYDEAFEAFKKGGDEAQAYNNLGCVYLQEGKLDAAIGAFGKAMASKTSFYAEAGENLKRAQTAKQNGASPPPLVSPPPQTPSTAPQAAAKRSEPLLLSPLPDKPEKKTVKAASEILPEQEIETPRPNPEPQKRYVVVAGSFRVREKALKLKDRLQNKKYPASVSVVKLSLKGRCWRVMVGKYAHLQEARKVAFKLETEEKLPVLIMKNEVSL